MGLLNWDIPRSLAFAGIENVSSSVWTEIINLRLERSVFICQIICSGDVYAKFGFFVDGEMRAVKRSGPERNAEFDFRWPLYFRKKADISVKVIHYRADELPDFECGLFGFNYS